MEIPVLREPAAMILIGSWLLLQCYDSVVREDVKAHLFCVSGKLVFVTGFLLLYPFPAYGLLYFFSFYPKTERNGSSLWLSGLQLVFPAGAAFLCGAGKAAEARLFLAAGIFLAALFLAVSEFVLRSLVLKNRMLYRQMERAALIFLR